MLNNANIQKSEPLYLYMQIFCPDCNCDSTIDLVSLTDDHNCPYCGKFLTRVEDEERERIKRVAKNMMTVTKGLEPAIVIGRPALINGPNKT